MTHQQPELFRVFVSTAFPRFFGLNRYRVHVPWTVYIADQVGKTPALDGAIYCITSVFLGRSYSDSKLQKSSREVYGKALAAFVDVIKDTTKLASRETLSTSILLSMFETYMSTDQNSWARHASGAALLMSMRGPTAHFTGFDRCLYLSFRSFLVAEAFIHGTPCLFERPQWQTLIDAIRKQDMVDPRASAQISSVIDVSDRLFMEVVKLPGLIHHVRRLSQSSRAGGLDDDDKEEARALETRVQRCRHTIHTLTAELRIAVTTQVPQPVGEKSLFIGPVPSSFPQTFADGLIQGTDVCFKILYLLLHNLSVICQESQTTRADCAAAASPQSSVSLPSTPGSFESDPLPSGLISFHLVSRLNAGQSESPLLPRVELRTPVDKWLDHVASSLGMGAVEVIVDSDPSAVEDPHLYGAVLPLR
ncbi:hypothetical protein FE257_012442 [Aspergillus nanangensis]|uniref:Uncharacterized protein n=1 Tax=Aspergillus nanangensis TaxID=2582783 RepID=A0AAD4CUY7_ASPNN|nr:hypothetical protein FE257_012442 [Aspergillus nanangensis]